MAKAKGHKLVNSNKISFYIVLEARNPKSKCQKSVPLSPSPLESPPSIPSFLEFQTLLSSSPALPGFSVQHFPAPLPRHL